MKILAIETSCDETSAAIVEDGRKIDASVIYSQVPIHELYGGVVPEIASRNHLDKIAQVVDQALKEAGCTLEAIDALAVTYGPGLVGALLVGINYAKGLAYALDKPLIPVNHIEGHISASLIEHPDLEPPFLCLVVSGGHSHLVEVKDYTSFNVVGQTRDDAIGEAYDKVARTLGLPYPGGPHIDRLAQKGNGDAIHFTRTYLEKDTYDFSFSGIKSGVLNYLNQQRLKHLPVVDADVAASFQEAVLEVLVAKSMMALDALGYKSLVIAGGVASNSRLRTLFHQAMAGRPARVFYPSPILCTDNAAMIGTAAYFKARSLVDKGIPLSLALDLNAYPALKIGENPSEAIV